MPWPSVLSSLSQKVTCRNRLPYLIFSSFLLDKRRLFQYVHIGEKASSCQSQIRTFTHAHFKRKVPFLFGYVIVYDFYAREVFAGAHRLQEATGEPKVGEGLLSLTDSAYFAYFAYFAHAHFCRGLFVYARRMERRNDS